ASLTAGHSGTLGGVWGSSCALVAATLARHCPGALVVVAPRPAMIDTLVDDARLFTQREIVSFAPAETSTTARILDSVASDRLRLVKRLANQPSDGSLPLIITSIQALMQPVLGRDDLAQATRTLKV